MIIPDEYKKHLTNFQELVHMHPFRDHLIRPKLDVQPWSPGVYILLNPKTREFYIGSSSHMLRRASEHRSDVIENKHMNKKVQESFEKSLHMQMSFMSLDDRMHAYRIEQELLNLNRSSPLLLNIALDAVVPGKGLPCTPEAKIKIGNAHRGVPCPEHVKKAVSLANTGRRATEAQIQAVIRTNKTRVYSVEEREVVRKRMLGNQHGKLQVVTQEKIERMRNLNLGKKLSDEVKNKIREKRKITQSNESYRDPRSIEVIIEGKVFKSISNAAQVLGMLHGTVWGRIKSKSPEYSEWKYLNDN